MRKYNNKDKTRYNKYAWQASASLSGETVAKSRSEVIRRLEERYGDDVKVHVVHKGEQVNEGLYNATTHQGEFGIAVFSHTADSVDFWRILQMPNNDAGLRVVEDSPAIDKSMPMVVRYTLDNPYATPVDLNSIAFDL